MNPSSVVHVAVGVLINSSGEVLISLRHPDSHQGGLWEFPGGKLEAGEEPRAALKREFAEELGVEVCRCFPLKKIQYDYPDKSVLLDIWRIVESTGTPKGLEGQAVEWRAISDLKESDFPAANAPIINCLKLPAEIAITPNVSNFGELQQIIHTLLNNGVRLIQFRQTELSAVEYLRWFEWADERCSAGGVKLMFNQKLADFPVATAAGYHASANRLMQLQQRPLSHSQLFSASCHNLNQLQQAQRLEADFVYLSPVHPTDKYPDGRELGWEGFQKLVEQSSVPVYALGGVARNELAIAQAHGGFGISGIRCFLNSALG